MNRNFFISSLILALIILGLDQLTKWMILIHFSQSSEIISVTSFFNLLLVWNKGVSFGMFNSGRGDIVVILTIIPLLIVLALTVLLWQTKTRMVALALGTIIGGALGNIIDRIRFGGVIDFLDFHIINYHWPAFNIADSAIMIGVLFLLIDNLWLKSDITRKN